MTLVHRVLPPEPVESLDAHLTRRGGRGLSAALQVEPEAIIDEIEASGLRGRGGAGFPTHRKWRAVRENASGSLTAAVVINGAEGEPGTYKDRTILLTNPYAVLEGALIAARAVGAGEIVVGLKQTLPAVIDRVTRAIAELDEAGWLRDVTVTVIEGPDEYLYGEETALLEVIDGRYPLPRIAPPYRRGVDEVVETAADVHTSSGLSSHVEMAGSGADQVAPPALVDNVETLANVPGIIGRGGSWFRTEGTPESPGTMVCTVTGSVAHPGVAEFMMGTPLREVLQTIGGGPRDGREIIGVLPGVSNGFIPAAAFDAPLSYEGLAAIGSGLGSAGFIVLDDEDDPVALAAGASRFLAVESCGQCLPCKRDGLVLSGLLADLSRSQAAPGVVAKLQGRLATVATGARCYLASQQVAVIESLLATYPERVAGHADASIAGVEPTMVAELIEIADGVATLDERWSAKQPDWTYDAVDSGQAPADRLAEHRRPEHLT